MKKKVGLIIGVSLCVFVLGLGIFNSSATETSPTMTEKDIKEMVTEQYPGDIESIEKQKTLNKTVYEVKLNNDVKGYTLRMHGDTGEILQIDERTIAQAEDSNSDKKPDSDAKKDEEKNEQNTDSEDASNKNSDDNNEIEKSNENTNDKPDDKKHSEQHKDNHSHSKSENKNHDEGKGTNKKQDKSHDEKHNKKQDEKAVIDIRGAISIGLKEFRGTVTEIELDTEDGELVYEVEIVSGNEKAEIDINAYTGEILLIGTKSTDGIKGDSNSFINIKKAIGIALGEFSGTVVEVELEEEDDSYIYEVEIKSGGNSKDIEVDAYTGKIIDVD